MNDTSDITQRASKECDAWILWFSDVDREQVHFHGHGAKEAALKAYEQSKMAWTCRLYHCVAHSGYGPETAHDSVTPETASECQAAYRNTNCLKHGPHAPGECPQCDELAEARMIVSTTYIPPASAGPVAYVWSGEGMIRAIEGDVRLYYSVEDVQTMLSASVASAHEPKPTAPETPACSDERTLRRLLAIAYSGINLYRDDGELQDGSEVPVIDYVRDPVTIIEQKIQERGIRKLAKAHALKAPVRHSATCDCHDCHYAKKHPQVKPHHALCGCFECRAPKASEPPNPGDDAEFETAEWRAFEAEQHRARNKARGCDCNSDCDVHLIWCSMVNGRGGA